MALNRRVRPRQSMAMNTAQSFVHGRWPSTTRVWQRLRRWALTLRRQHHHNDASCQHAILLEKRRIQRKVSGFEFAVNHSSRAAHILEKLSQPSSACQVTNMTLTALPRQRCPSARSAACGIVLLRCALALRSQRVLCHSVISTDHAGMHERPFQCSWASCAELQVGVNNSFTV